MTTEHYTQHGKARSANRKSKQAPCSTALEKKLTQAIRTEFRKISEQPPPLPRSLLTEQETADLLGVSVKTLPIWRHRGQGPDYIKVESAVRYKLSDLREYINKQRVKAGK